MINSYTSWERADILKELKKQVKKTRFEHILRVEEKALELAEKYHADKEACQLAALLHDYAKDLDVKEVKKLQKEAHIDDEMLAYGSNVWHGPMAAYFAKEKFGITNPEILMAISQHTTGGREMSLVGKILFIADYIEEGRKFPGVKKARRLADKNIDRAVRYKVIQTLLHLVENEKKIYPETLEVYNQWV